MVEPVQNDTNKVDNETSRSIMGFVPHAVVADSSKKRESEPISSSFEELATSIETKKQRVERIVDDKMTTPMEVEYENEDPKQRDVEAVKDIQSDKVEEQEIDTSSNKTVGNKEINFKVPTSLKLPSQPTYDKGNVSLDDSDDELMAHFVDADPDEPDKE